MAGRGMTPIIAVSPAPTLLVDTHYCSKERRTLAFGGDFPLLAAGQVVAARTWADTRGHLRFGKQG